MIQPQVLPSLPHLAGKRSLSPTAPGHLLLTEAGFPSWEGFAYVSAPTDTFSLTLHHLGGGGHSGFVNPLYK